MSNYAKARIEKLKELERKKKVRSRWLDANVKAKRFCLTHKLTVYPAIQPNGRLKVFVQHHEKFEAASDTLYDQDIPEQMIEMYAFIDSKYEEFYDKQKHRGDGRFYIHEKDYSISPDSETIDGLVKERE